ncbi:hypothetical protein CQ010_12225 [Arthrobacter sp. MYb211]|uniref:gamma-glutamylcyclotransferase n=1 Tax=unclassified Arthrobacter TaxID=235627 RepID=UPI000CFB3322|nr:MULTISPECIES: gamma-glutamylcyclotransferase [unclassified Arthrobacter]PRA14058.1 hypothetical protein CQ015_01925 [Arthrobacter sp. MYb221]PRC06587.1 hypothetical protein CQ010_12225 [Arthrobacter sp. MYb211]
MRRWAASSRRDEILVDGQWVWTSVTDRQRVDLQYRYTQSTGPVYTASGKATGTIRRGTKAQWGTWNAKNRRNEVKVNGKWVWTDVHNRHKPAGMLPPVSNVSDYARFTTRSLSGFIKEKDNLRLHSPYSVAAYGTLRTGQSAYNVMGGFQQKAMNQRFHQSSLYQLWDRNWTFLTNGPKTVATEQFQYSDAKGPGMLRKLDIYESQLRYQGRPMYTRQNVRLIDGSQSWTYKTTAFSEKVVKNSGRYISSGDFLKRS